MSFKVTGTIQYISEITELPTGAKKLSYRIDTGEQYNNIYVFDIYKGADYAEHADNFVQYNKVGDTVEVEFNVSCREGSGNYEGRYFTNLQHWQSNKVDSPNAGSPASASPEPVEVGDPTDDLPF